MTILIGMIGKGFSMIAIDTRMTDVDVEGKIVSYNDEFSKLHDVKFGWLATTGSKEISEKFSMSIVENNITNTSDIPILFDKINREVRAKYCGDFKGIFDETLTLFSYSYKEEDLIKFNIEFISSNYGRAGIAGINKVVILPPNVSQEMKNLEEQYKPLIEGSNSLNELILQTSNYIEEVSKINKTVSDICEFGFMFNTINAQVTRKYLRGKAKDIRKHCLESNIEMYFQDRSPIIWSLNI